MKFSVNKTELQSAISAPAKIASKAIIDWMGCLLFTAEGDMISIEASNQVDSVQVKIPALVEEKGRALISAKLLTGMVKNLPDASVMLEADDCSAKMSCGKSVYKIACVDPDLMKRFPKLKPDSEVTLSSGLIASIFKRVIPFASHEDRSPEVQRCAYFQVAEEQLKVSATDSYRLIQIAQSIESNATFEAMIPTAFLANVDFSLGENASIAICDNQISIKCGESTFVTRAVAGKYPNVGMLLKDETETMAGLSRMSLIGAVKRAMAIASKDDPIRLSISDETLKVSLNGKNENFYEEPLEAKTVGMCYASMNPRYLSEALTAINDHDLEIRLLNPIKPIHLTGVDSHIVLMPIRDVRE